MQLELGVPELKSALAIVRDTIGNDTQGHEGLRLFVNKKGRVKLTTNDGNYATETWIDSNMKKPGKVVVKAKLFTQYISKLDVDIVTLSLNNKGNLIAKSKRGQQTFNSFDESSFQTLPKSDVNESMTMSGRVYKQLVGGVAFAASDDKNRPLLEGVNLISDGKSIRLSTTNGDTVATYKKKMTAPLMNATIGKKALVNAMKLVKDDQKITIQSCNDTRFIIKVADTSFHLPTYAGKYPDVTAIIHTDAFPLEFTVEKTEFTHMLDRASLMLDSKGILQFEKGKVILTGETENGNFNEYIMANLQGKATDVRIDIKSLADIVKNIDAEVIAVGVRDQKPLTIKPDSKSAHTCLLTIAAS